MIAGDGAGGAIVTWVDSRSSGNPDIYAQHVLASGVVDPAWPADGRGVCTAANNQYAPTIVTDGAGGAIVTWEDQRSGADYDVYAQHVLASGTVDPIWPVNGGTLCNAANYQYNPTIASDGVGGAIVTWYDYRGRVDRHLRAACIGLRNHGFRLAHEWTRRCAPPQVTNTTRRSSPDGAGGAIVSWHDLRSGSSNDIYAQRAELGPG
jgi:hypothetical protein